MNKVKKSITLHGFEARPYQYETAYEAFTTRKSRQILITAPAASGKTIIITHLVRMARQRNWRVLIITHRLEIIASIQAKLKSAGYDSDLVLGDRTTEDGWPVIVASIDTLRARDLPKDIKLVIIDEAHRSVARSYMTVIAHYLEKGARLIGLTATPCRMDNIGLKAVYKTLIVAAQPSDLLPHGWIVAPRIISGNENVIPDLQDVRVVNGDYDVNQLSKKVMTEGLIGSVIDSIHKNVGKRQTVVFTCSIAHSEWTTQRLRRAGLNAQHVDGTMPVKERNRIRSDFEEGRSQFLSNCSLLSEGWDMQTCDAVVLYRPTRSRALYIQQCGRCMRPGGTYSPIVIDHTWNSLAHGLPFADRIWSLEGKTGELKNKKDAEFKKCPNCSTLCTAGSDECPNCSWRMASVGRILIPGERPQYTLEDRTDALLQRVEELAKEKGLDATWLKDTREKIVNALSGKAAPSDV